MKKTFFVVLVTFLTTILVPTVALADNDGSSVQIGLSGVNTYSDMSSLNTAISCVDGLKGIVDHTGTNWGTRYTWYNNSVWELDFRSSSYGGNDYRLADDADLTAYCGHGTPSRNLRLNTEKDSKQAALSQMRLGDRDCEWFLAFTCNFLNGSISEVGPIANGVHTVCGFATTMIVTANGGGVFTTQACYGNLPVTTSWIEYARQTQPRVDGKQVAYLVGNNNSSDRLWGFGNVTSDPISYSSNPSGYQLVKLTIDYL